MDCTWPNQNNGCAGGYPEWALSWMIKNQIRVAYEDDYPYLGVDGACWTLDRNTTSPGIVTKCWHIPHTKLAVKKALYKLGPLAISIDVTQGMLLYIGGAFNDSECSGVWDKLDHTVLLTGWKIIDGVEVWEIKNSWSTYWGDNGYLYVQNENQESGCGITTDAIAVEVGKNQT
jgi:hypothetical protein